MATFVSSIFSLIKQHKSLRTNSSSAFQMATLGILCQLNIITVSTQKVMNDIQIYCIAEDRLPSPLAV